jgi:hypothetical protein
MILPALLVAAALMAEYAPPPPPGQAVSDCDRLAANPEDQDRLAPPVAKPDVDLPRAIAACETAVAADPTDVRARYQLGRVLTYDGQTARGSKELKASADAGYRQAQFVYGLEIERGRKDVPTNLCAIEPYWFKSAVAGRQAARVSYVRHVVKGKFAACKIQASPAQMRGFLEAADKEGDYYLKLLTADLREQLAVWEKR